MEFQEVLRQWRRMCQCNNCKECPGRTIGNKDNICILTKTENRRTEAEIEDIITAWAWDHPEPQYETWLEFVKRFETGEPKSDKDFIYWMGTTSIPADIAEKLGIEPKEGT